MLWSWPEYGTPLYVFDEPPCAAAATISSASSRAATLPLWSWPAWAFVHGALGCHLKEEGLAGRGPACELHGAIGHFPMDAVYFHATTCLPTNCAWRQSAAGGASGRQLDELRLLSAWRGKRHIPEICCASPSVDAHTTAT
jgi:hypothetical protein